MIRGRLPAGLLLFGALVAGCTSTGSGAVGGSPLQNRVEALVTDLNDAGVTLSLPVAEDFSAYTAQAAADALGGLGVPPLVPGPIARGAHRAPAGVSGQVGAGPVGAATLLALRLGRDAAGDGAGAEGYADLARQRAGDLSEAPGAVDDDRATELGLLRLAVSPDAAATPKAHAGSGRPPAGTEGGPGSRSADSAALAAVVEAAVAHGGDARAGIRTAAPQLLALAPADDLAAVPAALVALGCGRACFGDHLDQAVRRLQLRVVTWDSGGIRVEESGFSQFADTAAVRLLEYPAGSLLSSSPRYDSRTWPAGGTGPDAAADAVISRLASPHLDSAAAIPPAVLAAAAPVPGIQGGVFQRFHDCNGSAPRWTAHPVDLATLAGQQRLTPLLRVAVALDLAMIRACGLAVPDDVRARLSSLATDTADPPGGTNSYEVWSTATATCLLGGSGPGQAAAGVAEGYLKALGGNAFPARFDSLQLYGALQLRAMVRAGDCDAGLTWWSPAG